MNDPIFTGGVSCSWRVSGPTSFSAEVETADLLRRYQTTDLRSYWLRWEHPTLGVWAGEITDCEASASTGTTELAARDFSSLLESRRIAKVYDVDAAPAGALFKRIIVDAGRESGGYSWIRTIYADETGDPVTLRLRGGTVAAAISSLESRSGDEWWIDDQRQAWWQHRRGRNLTGTVVLAEGRHISDYRYTVALGPLVNDLLVVPADDAYAVTQSFIVDDDASIIRFGRRQDQLTYTGFVTESTLRPVALKDLARLKKLGDTISFDVANVDGCFASFRDGDRITLLLPGINRVLTVRVMVRSYDTDSGILRVTADVES